MGLDACVYCDCFEKGKLHESPPKGMSLVVESDGSLSCKPDKLPLDRALIWNERREQWSCAHTGGRLLHQRLGNITLIGMLRSELQRECTRFPILLAKVVYSGSHAGDFLPIEIIPALKQELKLLGDFKCSTKDAAAFMAHFRAQMLELVAASLSVGKPIAF